MQSLRWRIAVWYALLLVLAIGALGIAITFRFEGILRAQAQAHIVTTMQDIQRVALPGGFAFPEPDILLSLESPDNLDRWSSITTFIEVDNLRGYPISKSFNTGAIPTFGDPGVTLRTPSTMREVRIGNRPFLVGAEMLASGNFALIVQVAEPLDQLYSAFHQTQVSIALIILISVGAVAVLSYIMASEVTQPLDDLTRTMSEIGSEGLHRRIRWRGRQDEVGRLARAFDDLLARLEEAFARERQFISDASHELKTPLTSINANAQMLSRWGDKDEGIRKDSLQTIIDESASLAGMVNGMLTLAKADTGADIPKEPQALSAIAREAVNATSGRAAEKGLTLKLESASESPIVEGDGALLRQMMTNLIDNAIKFTSTGGVTVRTFAQGDTAVFQVEDTGPGIDEQELPLVFDRFYRSDKSRTRTVPGTGLGLAIVRSIARIHSGTVQAQRAPGAGALFTVRLPCIH